MSEELTHAQNELAEANRIVANAGLAEQYTGHVTTVVDDDVLVPAHLHHGGRGMESITPEHIVAKDRNTGELYPPNLDVPDELDIHTAIYEEREDVNSVVHSHPPHATALSIAEKTLVAGSLHAVRLGEVPIHDAGAGLIHEGADDPRARGSALAEALGDASAILIRGHGVVTVGKSIEEAVVNLDLIERASELQLLADQEGGPVAFPEETTRSISDEKVGEIYKYMRRQHLDEIYV